MEQNNQKSKEDSEKFLSFTPDSFSPLPQSPIPVPMLHSVPLLRQASHSRLGSGPCSDFLPLLISNSLHPLWLDPHTIRSTFWGPFQHPHILPHTFPYVLHSGISTFAASFSAPASPCESPALSQTCLLRGAPSSHDQLKF